LLILKIRKGYFTHHFLNATAHKTFPKAHVYPVCITGGAGNENLATLEVLTILRMQLHPNETKAVVLLTGHYDCKREKTLEDTIKTATSMRKLFKSYPFVTVEIYWFSLTDYRWGMDLVEETI